MRDPRLTRALLISFSLMSGGLLADSAWTIPGIVNAAGLNGTHFVSDLTVTNPGGAPANVTLSFFPGLSSPKNLTLNPGQTIVYSDVVGSLFGISGGAGALSLSSDQPLLIRAKTYNTAPSGTYGVALPVIASDRLLAPGDVGDSLWISQDASGSSGYRTNVAVVFPDASGGAATVTVYDADGNARGSQDFSLDSAGLQQFSVSSFAGAVSVGRAQVVVTRGHAAGYAVVVDNVTGDSSLFAFEDVPAGIQDVLVNGVARASGRNGAFFRTDGRFYNPTDTDATVTVAFHASGNANPTPASASFTIPAGKILDVVDVLESLLGLPVGSAGALRFQSNWPIAILCRTSNVDPSGVRPGSFGSQQKPVPLLSFVTSADAGAAVTGIRQNAAFRTNVGFAAGADGAQYTFTLQDASGATVATTLASLGSFGWTQPGIQDLFTGTTIPDNATLTVRVTAGSVDVFDSSIDNLSGDPVVTPIAQLPAVIPSSATIGPQGGSIRSDDGRLTLRVPAGALASNISLSFVTSASNDAPQGTGPSYTLSPGGLDFAKPATLVLRYDGDDLDGSAAGELGIAFQSGSTWYVVTGGSVNPVERTLTVPLGSTTQATPNARATLVDPPRKWTGFRSVQMFPGKAGIPTNGKLTLVVLDVGTPSSVSPEFGGSPLTPVDPDNTTYAWDLNGVAEPGPGLADGTLISSGIGSSATNNANYYAPQCPPTQNPVIVRVTLGVKTAPFPHFTKTLLSSVRVVNRSWSFKVTWDDIILCPLQPSDRVKYVSGFSFDLDDSLKATNVVNAPATTEYFGKPVSCRSYEQDFVRTSNDPLEVTLSSGVYDPEEDLFNLTLDWKIPTAIGYTYTAVGNDGTRFPGQVYPAGPVVPIPGVLLPRPEGTSPFHLFLGVFEASLSVDLLHTGSCP